MCGVMSGDVSNVPLEDLDLTTEVVFTGPPCPPFSTIGKTLGQLDRRCHVFIVIMNWIIHLATHGNLMFFVIENVVGILKRQRGESPFAAWVVAELRAGLPQGWTVAVQRAKAMNAHLPQHRERVFITGYCPRMQA